MSELSVRERILQQIKTDFEQMGTDYPFEWSYITRADLDTREYGKRYSIAILDTTEAKTPQIGHMECTLTIVLQWFATINSGDDPSTECNKVLTAIGRKLRENWRIVEDGTGLQLALDTNEIANSIDIADARDRQIGGTMDVQVLYRHARDDPRETASKFTRN